MSIPPFQYLPDITSNVTLDADVFTQWQTYVDKHFNVQELAHLKEPTMKALDYNLERIKEPLNNAELEVWSRVIIQARSWYRIGTFLGTYLRLFYEKSEPHNQNDLLVKVMLSNKCSKTDRLDFISAVKDDYSVFNKFYTHDSRTLNELFLLAKNEFNSGPLERERFNYLVKYIYSPSFVENDTKYNVHELVLVTNSLTFSLPVLLSETFKTKKEQLTFLTSVLYLVDKALDVKTYLVEAPVMKTKLVNFFEEQYPEQYQQYKVLKDLNVTITLSELITQLCTQEHTVAFELPELT